MLRVPPAALIEFYLLRHSRTYAIMQHPDRHNAADEVLPTKNWRPQFAAAIDQQVKHYEDEGRPLIFDEYETRQGWLLGKATDVPDSQIIMREHVPLSDLFSCLMFNEVVRFQYRDQIAWGYLRKRMSLRLPIFMFPRCSDDDNFWRNAVHLV